MERDSIYVWLCPTNTAHTLGYSMLWAVMMLMMMAALDDGLLADYKVVYLKRSDVYL
ncbi:hypothetical protein DOY81_005803 [Sarcophaga bullata]|nr:hypothetical protein DOY81_005803 [Sarcophaga bullata]